MSFEEQRLEELCELVIDCPHSTPKWTDEGFIVLRNQNIRNGVLDLSTPSFTDEDGYKNRIKRAKPKANDIVFTREAPMGEVCLIPEGIECCLGQRQVLLRANNKVDPYYLFWALQSPYVQHQISWNEGTGTTVSNVRIPVLKDLKIPRLGVAESWIAKTMTSLALKSQINKKINQTLEQMAQALFKSWFVDFEPVKAKIAVLEAGGSQEDATLAAMTAISGKYADALAVFERKHPEQYAELKATAELFPSAMQNSELGEIPEGWCHGPLSDIATFANGKVDVCSLTPETYISTENMLENRAGISTASSLPSVNSVPEFRCGHVLISNIRPYFKKIWLARFKGGRSADVLAFEALDSVNVEYVYNLLYQEVFFNFMMLTSKGVKMPRGDKKAIMDWQCVHPDKKISNAFSKAVGEYYSFIEINNAQNKTLTQLRDTLLPKLLSGEITLPEVEQAIGEVENV
ncbi:TPA: restriction endonuclease subunit S [Serratia marcescens]